MGVKQYGRNIHSHWNSFLAAQISIVKLTGRDHMIRFQSD